MAASKVNTKFVAILVGGLATVAVGGGGVLYFFVANNATRLATLGEAAMQSGDYVKAERLLSKAVNKEQTNPELLRKWIAALEKLTPESENSFRDKYGEYFAANVALARRALQTDIAAHRNALEMAHREIKDRIGDTTGNAQMVDSVDLSLSYFEHAKDTKHDVLRKYSGMALQRSYEAAANLKDAEILRARTDLEKAVAADPDDGEAATGLARWHDRTAFVLQQKNDTEGYQAEREQARKILADFLASHPDNVDAVLWDFLSFVTVQEEKVRGAANAEARAAVAKEGAEAANAKLDRLAEVLGKLDTAKIEVAMVDRLSAMELRFTADGPKRAAVLYDKILAVRPDDTRVLLSKATLLGEARKEKEAMGVLQTLVDVKQKPVSFEGVMQFSHRARARYLQSLYTMRLWEQEKDKTARAALFDQAKAFRAKLGEVADADSPDLLFIDAHLSIAAEDFGQAQKKLLEFNRKTRGTDIQGLWMASQCALVLGQDGTAESTLKDLLRREPSHLRANIALGDLYASRLKRPESALPYYDVALEIDGSNQKIRQVRDAIRNMKEPGAGGAMDAISQALLECDKLENSGKAEQAFELLKKTYGDTKDVRLVPPLAVRMSKRGSDLKAARAEALALVEEALTRAPSDQRLKQARIVLVTDDPLQQRLMVIEMTEAPEIEKWTARVQVYRIFAAEYERQGKAELAAKTTALGNEALAKAVQLAPNNAAVLEMQFIQALSAKDYATAGRIAEEAKKNDLDVIGGATFRARLLDAQGRLADAARELESARSNPNFSPSAGRILAEMMVRQRRVSDAVQVLTEGLEKKKTDRDSLYALTILLMRLDQGQAALEAMRDKQMLHAGDSEIQDLWLELEATFGSKDVALAQRLRQLDIDPGNTKAKLAVAQLLIQKREFVGARKHLDELKAGPARDDATQAQMVQIEAQWYSEQGDLAGAKKVFDDHIASIPADRLKPDVFLAKGRFMERIDQINEAVAAFREAGKHQDPKTLDADRALSDLLFRQGELPEAIKLFRKIVESKADTIDSGYAKKLIDALLRINDGPGATAAIAAMGAAVDDDAQLTLQRAEAVRLGGDEKKALEIIEGAATKFPNDPYVFYRRANLNLRYPELRKDVISDLNKAIELRPSFWQARRDLARIKVQDGDFDAATAQMRDAVKFNPGIDELRVQLVRDLLSQGRDADAAEVIEAVIERRRDDVGLLLNSGDLMREARKNDSALNYYRRAYAISQQMAVVTRYIDLLHASNPPQIAVVDEILKKLKDVQDKEPPLLMARAKQYIFRNKVEEGIKDMISSLRLIRPDQPGMIMAWFGDIKRMLSKQEDVTRIIGIVEKENLIPGWTTFFKAGTLMEKNETQAEATAMLEEMVKTTKDEVLLRQAMLTLQARYYQKGDCPNALRVMRESESRFPGDAFVLNNLAYMMVRCGEDPAAAVPIAERAVQAMLAMNRSSADVLDTMGWVYVKAKNAEKAGLPCRRPWPRRATRRSGRPCCCTSPSGTSSRATRSPRRRWPTRRRRRSSGTRTRPGPRPSPSTSPRCARRSPR